MGIVTGAPQNHASKIQIKYYLMENIGDYWISTEFLAFPNYKGFCTLGLGGNVDATIKKNDGMSHWTGNISLPELCSI